MEILGRETHAVIFDIDGVLLQFFPDYPDKLVEAAQKLGLSNGSRDHMRRIIQQGAGRTDSWISYEEFIAKHFRISPEQARKFLAYFFEYERRHPYDPVQGARETLNWFKMRGIQLAVCTSNSLKIAEEKLSLLDVPLSFFAAVNTGDQKPCKPDPAALIRIMQSLGVSPSQAIYFGDWGVDKGMAGRVPGLRFFAVETGGVSRKTFRRLGVPAPHIFAGLSDFYSKVLS